MTYNKSKIYYNRKKSRVKLDRTQTKKRRHCGRKMVLDWNSEGGRERPKNTYKRTSIQEISKERKT